MPSSVKRQASKNLNFSKSLKVSFFLHAMILFEVKQVFTRGSLIYFCKIISGDKRN
jgi:hypothetical protein